MPRKAASKISREDAQLAEGLRSLGLTDYEIRVYLGILRHPLSRIPEIARWSGVPQPKVYATVKRLISRGLCETHLGPVNTYSALPPKNSFTPLLEELRAQHVDAKEVIKTLQKEHTAPSDSLGAREGRIKVFQGNQATSRNFRFLLSRVHRDVALLSRRPFVVSDDDELMREAIERGVRVRIVVEIPDGFEVDDEPVFRRQVEIGCESRHIERVPMRLAIFDQKVALLPLHDTTDEGGGSMILEVRNEILAGGMLEIFEDLWEKATPFSVGRKRRSS